MGALGDGGVRGIRLLLCDVRTYAQPVKHLIINLPMFDPRTSPWLLSPVREVQMEFTYFIIII